jgi:hypothetical protein
VTAKSAPVLAEIREVVQKAKPFHIIKGKTYLYFSVQPTQEAVVFQQIIKKRLLGVVAVYNYKDTIIGYLVEFKKKPYLDISKNAEGAAIFFSGKTAHTNPKVLFSDHKLRILAFGDQDFFISVKWKSNQALEEL